MLDPHNDGSDEDEGMVVPRAFLISCDDAAELLEPVDRAFHAIALPIQSRVELRTTTWAM